MLYKFKEVIRLCYTPYSIFSPIPFFAILLFLIAFKLNNLSTFHVPLLFAGMGISLLSSFASNLWNHTNDLKEDIVQDKINALTQNIISYRFAAVLSFILYILLVIIVGYISIKVGRPIYLYFIIWSITTWWYSDNIFFKKIIGYRLKSHYLGELITYSVAYPFFTLSIWLIYSELSIAGLALALAFLFFGISVVLLKDIKDISGDRKAQLKTFGVIFPPSKLFHASCIFLLLYYAVILISVVLNIFSYGIFLIALPFFYFIKNIYIHFSKKGWRIDAMDSKNIDMMIITTYISIIILGAGTFI